MLLPKWPACKHSGTHLSRALSRRVGQARRGDSPSRRTPPPPRLHGTGIYTHVVDMPHRVAVTAVEEQPKRQGIAHLRDMLHPPRTSWPEGPGSVHATVPSTVCTGLA